MPNVNSQFVNSNNPSAGVPSRVLVVDDSLLMRKILTSILDSDPSLEVVGQAKDAYEARDLIKKLNPDVLTLDVEMPGMSGIQFLRNLMRLRPMPVVMVSTKTSAGSKETLDALEIGAVDFIEKPQMENDALKDSYIREFIAKVKSAAKANVKRIEQTAQQSSAPRTSCLQRLHDKVNSVTGKIIAIGSSTGGTEALKEVLTRFPKEMPPIVITQHIPAAFSSSFAERMDTLCKMHVAQATEGMEIVPGSVYIAPGDKHLLVVRKSGRLYCSLDDGPPVNQHKPSVEMMFDSIGNIMPKSTVSVMLTGMGDDGANAMKRLKDQGSYTIGQDEATSVVWGMPGQAYKKGALITVKPLQEIANEVVSAINKI
jgi:two-component system chemotaxis response regulator CheB